MSDLIEQARQVCGGYYRQGYNCAESIFLGFRELVLPDVDPELVRCVSNFGEGIGRSGCLCGAISAAIMVLGFFTGRTTNDPAQQSRAMEHAAGLYSGLETAFGTTCCRVLNPHPFESKDRLRNCLKITGNTAKVLMEYLIRHGLVAG